MSIRWGDAPPPYEPPPVERCRRSLARAEKEVRVLLDALGDIALHNARLTRAASLLQGALESAERDAREAKEALDRAEGDVVDLTARVEELEDRLDTAALVTWTGAQQ